MRYWLDQVKLVCLLTFFNSLEICHRVWYGGKAFWLCFVMFVISHVFVCVRWGFPDYVWALSSALSLAVCVPLRSLIRRALYGSTRTSKTSMAVAAFERVEGWYDVLGDFRLPRRGS